VRAGRSSPASEGRAAAVTSRGAAPAAPAIAAIVCTYNRHALLIDAVRSLEAQTLDPRRFEIVVVDNSTDLEARTEFWRDAPEITNLRAVTEDIPGLSRARNIGMRTTAAPIVAYMDDDAVAVPEWLESLLETFEADPSIGIAGGPVEPIWPGGAPPWLHKWLQGFLTIVDLGAEPRMLEEGEWLAGTNIAFRRAPLEAAGGFNETLGRVKGTLLSNEELAISDHIHKEGLISYYVPAARMFHRVHADRISQSWMRRRASWQIVSDLLAGAASDKDPAELWRDVSRYLMRLPVEMRNLRGLFLDVPDPELFHQQCTAIGALMHLLLDSGGDPDPVQS
jgi:glucosyl-dolichyl phosphate glucuronosyltransferase